MITDPFFYLVAIPAVLIVGISKGGFGGGLGLIAVPMLTLAVGVSQAAAIMLPILCVMDLFALWGFRGRFDKRNLLLLIPAAILGIVVGALTFQFLNDDHLRVLIGTVTLWFCGHWYLQKLRKQSPPATGANTAKGIFWGALSGFTSFSVHAGGPPLSIYLLPQKLDKTIFVGTTVIFFTVVNYVKLLPYGMLGLLPIGNLATSLVLIPLAPIGIKLGLYLHDRVNTTLFFNLVYGFLLLTGGKLLWEGAAAFL